MIVEGFALIATAYAVAALSLIFRGRILRLLTGAVAFMLGLIAALAFLGLLAIDREPFNCEIPGQDSATAPSHFTWVPPGTVCEFPTGDVGPTYWRIPAGLAIVALPGAYLAAWPLRRRYETEALMMESVV